MATTTTVAVAAAAAAIPMISTSAADTTTTAPSTQSVTLLPSKQKQKLDAATVVVNIDDDEHDEEHHDDEESIDEDQLNEFREQLVSLGNFPDKVIINTLSMIADDYKDSHKSAHKLYHTLRHRLLTCAALEKLPVIYVLDSILKNCKGSYIPIVQDDAVHWMALVHQALVLDVTLQHKLQKVWRTWNEYNLFEVNAWKQMGRCFTESNALAVAGLNGTNHNNNASLSSASLYPTVAGIARNPKDGSLILSTGLRREMQNILDDLQGDSTNELDKVSLERLADINPDLLANIKQAAAEGAGVVSTTTGHSHGRTSGGTTARSGTATAGTSDLPLFLSEIRSPAAINASNEWHEFTTTKTNKQQQFNFEQETKGMIQTLNDLVAKGTNADNAGDTFVYTQKEALKMTGYYATCLSVAELVTIALRQMTPPTDGSANTAHYSYSVMTNGSSGTTAGGNHTSNRVHHDAGARSRLVMVNPADFSNEGLKKRNPAAISLLYEIGLPFQSAVDGRRFPTQLQLSDHLDALFKRKQIRKSMAVTEERGWYAAEKVWTQEETEGDAMAPSLHQESLLASRDESSSANRTNAVPADESRGCCVVCGIHFKMVFDNDDGVYKYSNCIELLVYNDDAAENESDLQLLHVTCWKGLGEPTTLTYDQTLPEAMRH